MMIDKVAYPFPFSPEASSGALCLAPFDTQKRSRTAWYCIELWALSRVRLPVARKREHQQILKKARHYATHDSSSAVGKVTTLNTVSMLLMSTQLCDVAAGLTYCESVAIFGENNNLTLSKYTHRMWCTAI